MNKIPLQLELSPALPNVCGALDYREFRETLIKIDEILTKSSFEHNLVSKTLDKFVAKNQIDPEKFYNSKKVSCVCY